jgi:hypothetical protein
LRGAGRIPTMKAYNDMLNGVKNSLKVGSRCSVGSSSLPYQPSPKYNAAMESTVTLPSIGAN